jgi:hypothetical protein
VMTAQKAQADVLLHRLHYALPGWDAAAERRDAQDELHSTAQARAWADGDFDADHGFAFDFRRRGPPGALEPGARPNRGGGGGCARALAVYKPPPPKSFRAVPPLKICISPFDINPWLAACRPKTCAISTFAYASAVPRGWAVLSLAYTHRANVKSSEEGDKGAGRV